MQINKQRIKQAFSKSAAYYDEASDIQKDIACILSKKIHFRKNYPYILDIATGTGFLCQLLSREFLNSHIFACDISLEMAYKARKKALLQVAEAENLPYKENSFDLVASNASYQWSRDLTKGFQEAFRVLQVGGIFYFSIFGKNTFTELKTSIKKTSLDDISIKLASEDFVDFESLKYHLIKAGFHNIEVECKYINKQYKDLTELLYRLKNMGANLSLNFGIKGLGWRRVLKEIEKIYKREYTKEGYIPAQYEIFFAKAKK